MKATQIINEAFEKLCTLTVSGPGVEAVAAVMGLLRQAFAAASELESENEALKQTDRNEEDDGK